MLEKRKSQVSPNFSNILEPEIGRIFIAFVTRIKKFHCIAHSTLEYRLKSAKQVHLLNGLGVDAIEMLRRSCERQTKSRRAACPLFGRSAEIRSAKPRFLAGNMSFSPQGEGARCSGRLTATLPHSPNPATLLFAIHLSGRSITGTSAVRFAPGASKRDRPIGARQLLRCSLVLSNTASNSATRCATLSPVDLARSRVEKILSTPP